VKVVTIAAWMFLMGAVLWWATFFILPLAVQWEIPLATVDRVPIFGFCAGVLLGLAMALSKPVRNSAGYVAGAIVLGALVWLFVVGIVGLGLSIGGFEDEAFEGAMETVNTVATWLALSRERRRDRPRWVRRPLRQDGRSAGTIPAEAAKGALIRSSEAARGKTAAARSIAPQRSVKVRHRVTLDLICFVRAAHLSENCGEAVDRLVLVHTVVNRRRRSFSASAYRACVVSMSASAESSASSCRAGGIRPSQ
jgi:hypothetical protein